MNTPYYQLLLKYLEDKDEDLKTSSILLDFPLSEKDSMDEAADIFNLNQGKNLFPKKATERFLNAVNIHKRRDPQWSDALVDAECKTAKKNLVDYLQGMEKEEAARFMLHYHGYDIDGLEMAKELFLPDLVCWLVNHEIYIPVTDFFAPEHIANRNEEFGWKDAYSDPLRHFKIFGLEYLLPALSALALPFYALGSLASLTSNNLRRPLDTMKDDFNRFSSNNSNHLLDLLSGLYEKFKERSIMARYSPTLDMFFIEYIISDFLDPNDNIDLLYGSGFAQRPHTVKTSLQDNTQKLNIKFKEGYEPTELRNIPVPFGYTVRRVSDGKSEIVKGDWDLETEQKPLHATMKFSKEFQKALDELSEKDLSVSEIESELKNMFIYKRPRKYGNLSRFESATFSGTGVCQDVNFLFWYALRKKGVPSYLTLGWQGENGEIRQDHGHAKLIVLDKDKWLEFDATPSQREIERYKEDMEVQRKRASEILDKDAGSIGFVGRTLDTGIEAIASRYRLTKNQMIKGIVNLQKRAYASLLSDLETSLHEFDGVLDGIDNNAMLSDSEREELKTESINKAAFIYEIKNVPVVYGKGHNIGEIEKPFRPSQIRKQLHSLKYFTHALPEYIQRYHYFTLAENVLREVLQSEGELFPYSSKRQDKWEDLVINLFKTFAKVEQPPHPMETAFPRRWVFKARKHMEVYDNSKEEYIKLKRPKNAPSEIVSDERNFFHDNSSARYDKSVNDMIKFYRSQTLYPDWYILEKQEVDLRPNGKHYTYSPEVLSFDKSFSVRHEQYWRLIGDVMKKHIANSESILVYLVDALVGIKKGFNDGISVNYLRYQYYDKGFPA